MPDQSSDITLSQWVGKTLTGWEEIRQAPVFVDRLSEEERNGARVEVYEHSQESSGLIPVWSISSLAILSAVWKDILLVNGM